jgi:chemotaxis protein histidine kinase CheA
MAPAKMLRKCKEEVSSVFDKIDVCLSKYNRYKEMYDFLKSCPMVVELMEENRRLKKKNKKLEKAILRLCTNRGSADCEMETHNDVLPKVNKPSETPCISPIPSLGKKIKVEKIHKVVEVEVVNIDQEEEEAVQEAEEAEAEEEEEAVQEAVEEAEAEEAEEEEEEQEEKAVEEEQEEEAEAEEEVVEAEEEEQEEQEEKAVEEEEEEEQEEQEEQEEKAVEEEEEEEEEAEKQEEAEEEEQEVYEITIKKKTYYVSNETDSIIYGIDAEGDIGEEVGKYVNGVPTFFKK